jgi:hypothetical protein
LMTLQQQQQTLQQHQVPDSRVSPMFTSLAAAAASVLPPPVSSHSDQLCSLLQRVSHF